MNTPFPAYRGSENFVFVCYSHRDAEDVYREIDAIHQAGTNVWYDEGIRPGSEWTDELAAAITDCSRVLFFVTPRAVQSRHCRDEVQYATKLGKSIVVVYLEPTELPRGLDLVLGSIQAVHRFDVDPEDYWRRLMEAVEPAAEDVARSVPGHGALPDAGARERAPAGTPARGARRWPIAAGVALVVALAVAVYLYVRQAGEATGADPNSIAVLPLEDRGGFADDPYYPDSVSEDLLNRLTTIDTLRLASRRSSFAFRTADVDALGLVEIGRRLGVSNILLGYVMRRDDTLRVNLELVDVSSGREVVRWSNNYDNRPLTDMLVIQGEITRSIAREFLSEDFSLEDENLIAQQSTSNPAAYEFYLQARTILRAPLEDDVSLGRAADLFTRALALDADFTWAQAGLCATHVRAYRLGMRFDPARESCGRLVDLHSDLFAVHLALGDYYRETGELEKSGVELDAAVKRVPHSADAKISRAQLYARQAYLSQSELDRVRAEEAFLEAISVEPDYWYAYHEYANYLTQTNRFDEALEQNKIALAIEPGSVATLTNYGNVLYRLGRTDEAEEAWTRALRLTPRNRWAHDSLGMMYHYQQRYAEAVKHLEAACEISPDDHRVWGRLGESYRLLEGGMPNARKAFSKALALAANDAEIDPSDWITVGYMALYNGYLGNFAAADELLDRMFKLNAGNDPMTHYWAGLVAYETGDIDKTFHELDLALANGFSKEKHFIADEPALGPLRASQPERFQAMLDRY